MWHAEKALLTAIKTGAPLGRPRFDHRMRLAFGAPISGKFSRPEVQLNLVQNNVAVAANGHRNLELIVIRDLEYAGLRQRERYTHHPGEGVKDVEAHVVPEKVSGYLTRDGSEASG